MSSRILLVNPPFYRLLGSHYNANSLGIAYIASYLNKSGHDAWVYNADYVNQTDYAELREIFDSFVNYTEYFKNENDPIWEDVAQKIIDFKCPSSGMENKNLWDIIEDVSKHDEIKFVIGNREDFDWAKDRITEYSLDKICTLLFSPTFGEIDPQQIVEWILAENLPVRMQLQMHKMIWSPEEKGV